MEDRGGASFGGSQSYHINVVHLTDEALAVDAFHPNQLPDFEDNNSADPFHRFKWDLSEEEWYRYNFDTNSWLSDN